mgnify:CR=1 FL=1
MTHMRFAAGAALVAAVLLGALAAHVPAQPRSAASADAVGTAACAGCHAKEYEAWRGSQHDRAMEEANERTVEGDFGGAKLVHAGVTTRFFRRDGRFLRQACPDRQR